MQINKEDFSFRAGRRFRFFDTPSGGSVGDRNLLTISNGFGFLFAAQGKTLKWTQTRVIHELSPISNKSLANQEIVDFPQNSLNFGFDVSQLKCNCDGSTLAVVLQTQGGPIASFYDVRHFSTTASEQLVPFLKIPLSSTTNCKVKCFDWNPASKEMFAVCVDDGKVSVFSVHENGQYSIVGAAETARPMLATALSWSPKGKQLVVAFSDCSLCQFKPEMQPAKRIAAPAAGHVDFRFELGTIADICWLSTTVFAVVFVSKDESRSTMCIVSLHKDGASSYSNFEDEVCFPTLKGTPRYFFNCIHECAIMICASTCSPEVCAVGLNPVENCWQFWNLNESGRAELPLDRKNAETFPHGVAVDFTPQNNFVLDYAEGKTMPPVPILAVLSSDGLLVPFNIVYLNNNYNLCKPPHQMPAMITKPSARVVQEEGGLNSSTSHANAQRPVVQAPQHPVEQRQKEASVDQQAKVFVEQQQKTQVESAELVKSEQKRKNSENAKENENLKALRQNVRQVIMKTEQDLANLKSRTNFSSIGTKETLVELTRSLETQRTNVETICARTKELDANVAELRAKLTEELLRAEETNITQECLNIGSTQYFFKRRPLNTGDKKFLDNLRENVKRYETSVEELTAKLDSILIDADNASIKPINDGLLVYRTFSNIQVVLMQYKKRIAELQQFFSMVDENWSLRGKMSHVESKLDESASSEPSTVFSKLIGNETVKRECGLRRFLNQRKTVPVRKCVPTNLTRQNVTLVAADQKKQLGEIATEFLAQIVDDKPKLAPTAAKKEEIPKTSTPIFRIVSNSAPTAAKPAAPLVQTPKIPIPVEQTIKPANVAAVRFNAPPPVNKLISSQAVSAPAPNQIKATNVNIDLAPPQPSFTIRPVLSSIGTPESLSITATKVGDVTKINSVSGQQPTKEAEAAGKLSNTSTAIVTTTPPAAISTNSSANSKSPANFSAFTSLSRNSTSGTTTTTENVIAVPTAQMFVSPAVSENTPAVFASNAANFSFLSSSKPQPPNSTSEVKVEAPKTNVEPNIAAKVVEDKSTIDDTAVAQMIDDASLFADFEDSDDLSSKFSSSLFKPTTLSATPMTTATVSAFTSISSSPFSGFPASGGFGQSFSTTPTTVSSGSQLFGSPANQKPLFAAPTFQTKQPEAPVANVSAFAAVGQCPPGFGITGGGSPPGGFGASGGFGGKATFGGGSVFGGGGSSPSTAFGAGKVFGSGSTFGSLSPSTAAPNPAVPGGFASLAASNAPTFGSLASNTGGSFGTFGVGGGGFGGAAMQGGFGGATAGGGFGSAATGGGFGGATTGSGFGGVAAGGGFSGAAVGGFGAAGKGSAFGAEAGTGFGSFGNIQQQPKQQQTQQASFSQWRG